jgi:hypothetical protein
MAAGDHRAPERRFSLRHDPNDRTFLSALVRAGIRVDGHDHVAVRSLICNEGQSGRAVRADVFVRQVRCIKHYMRGERGDGAGRRIHIANVTGEHVRHARAPRRHELSARKASADVCGDFG